MTDDPNADDGAEKGDPADERNQPDESEPAGPLGDLASEIGDEADADRFDATEGPRESVTPDGTDPGESGDPGGLSGDHENPSGDPDELPGDREGPLSDVASEIDDVQESGGPAQELFETETAVGEIDREALWRQVAGEDVATRVEDATTVERESDPDGPTIERPEAETSSGVTVEDREERVVEKAKYCQSCEYFTEPPNVGCTHDGTEIMEMVDLDHYRVANCPVVKEDEELENV